jgi:hypothetical protein
MYSIKYYSLSTIEDIRDVWQNLQKGPDMTYFQSYKWHDMLAGLKWFPNNHYEIVIAVVSSDDTSVLLAPLFISKDNRYNNYPKGCYLWGDQGWSDYCNLVYREFDKAAFEYLLKS